MVSQPLGRVERQAVPKFGAVGSHSGVQGGNGCPVLLPIVCLVAGRRWTGGQPLPFTVEVGAHSRQIGRSSWGKIFSMGTTWARHLA